MYIVEDALVKDTELNATKHAPPKSTARGILAKPANDQEVSKKNTVHKNVHEKNDEEKPLRANPRKSSEESAPEKEPNETENAEENRATKKIKSAQAVKNVKKKVIAAKLKKTQDQKKERKESRKKGSKQQVEKQIEKKVTLANKLKTIAWIVAIIAIIAVLLFVKSRVATPPAQIAPEEQPSRQPAQEPEKTFSYKAIQNYSEPSSPEKKMGDAVVSEESLVHLESIDVTENPELFSNLKCIKDASSGLRYIQLRLHNTLQEDLKISNVGIAKGYNTYFTIRGLVDTDPGCKKEILAPEQSTVCDKIGFDVTRYGLVAGINRISAQVPGKTEALLIECKE